MTKKELIIILKDKNIAFNARDTKAQLEALLPKEKEIIEDTEEEFLVDKYVATYTSKGRKFTLGTYASVNDARKALDKAGANARHIQHVTK